jgi:phosphopantothenoylcysteine decarboxylase/phosphopantothenate--cysteine ligase
MAPGKRSPGSNPWDGLSVLLTVGPTREALDPVRFLTNASSGRMGYALAAEAHRRGAKVTVVHGPTPETPPPAVKAVPITTALQMRRKVLSGARKAAVVIAAAAVGDWRFPKISHSKMKSGRKLKITMVPNPDIAAELGSLRARGKLRTRALVGFALETHHWLEHAQAKLERKGLDLIVANRADTLASKGIHFALVARDRKPRTFPKMSKQRAAAAILDAVEAYL